jgi:hypothetical protein
MTVEVFRKSKSLMIISLFMMNIKKQSFTEKYDYNLIQSRLEFYLDSIKPNDTFRSGDEIFRIS